MNTENHQYAPYPAELAALVAECRYRPGWYVELADRVRDDPATHSGVSGGLTLEIITRGFDSHHLDKGPRYSVRHSFGVPAATYNRASWQRWLFERFLDVERHEAMEFFWIGGSQPYAPNHGPGHDPYVVRELTSDEDRRTSWRGVTKADPDFITPEPDEFKKM